MNPNPQVSLRVARVVPWLFAIAAFLAALPTLAQFGPTWDVCIGELAHGELYLNWIVSGDERFLDFSENGARPEHRAPHPDFDHHLYQWYETHPFMGLWSALSCRILWTGLSWLDAMSAHLLPPLLVGCLLLFVLMRFVANRAGAVAAIATACALALSPRFLCDVLSNPKDGSEACLYAIAMIAILHAIESGSTRWLLGAAALTACAVAQKVNALFVPIQAILYLVVVMTVRARNGRPALPTPWKALPAACLVFVLVYLACSPMLWSNTWENLGRHLGFFARAGSAFIGAEFPSYYAVLVTTPEVVLALAVMGLFARAVSGETRFFLALGACLPVVRTELTGGVNFDGVRHFLEFYPFLACLAGIGFSMVFSLGSKFIRGADRSQRYVFAGALSLACLTPLMFATAATWPYGTIYFNSWVGGFGEFQRTGHREGSDYWSASYWEGLAWIDEHAKPGSVVIVPIAPHVARSMAPCRLGPGVTWSNAKPPSPGGEVYVMLTTRRLLNPPVIDWVEKNGKPCHVIERQGGVLTEIYRFDDPAGIANVVALTAEQTRSEFASRRVLEWFGQNPEIVAGLIEKIEAEPHRADSFLLESVPPELLSDIRELLKRVPIHHFAPPPNDR